MNGDNFENFNADTQREIPKDFFDVPEGRYGIKTNLPHGYGSIQTTFPIAGDTPAPPTQGAGFPNQPNTSPASNPPASFPADMAVPQPVATAPLTEQAPPESDVPQEPDEAFHDQWMQQHMNDLDGLMKGLDQIGQPQVAPLAGQSAAPPAANPVGPSSPPAPKTFSGKIGPPDWAQTWKDTPPAFNEKSDRPTWVPHSSLDDRPDPNASHDQTARFYGRLLARGKARGDGGRAGKGQTSFGNSDLTSVQQFLERRPDAISDYYKRHPDELEKLQGG